MNDSRKNQSSVLGKLRDFAMTNRSSFAGTLLFTMGVVAFMGIITAEALYPGYSTSDNMISDLGASEPPNSIIKQPSSNIFSGSMFVSGVLVLLSVYSVHSEFRKMYFTIPFTLLGLGVLGVGVFNGSWGGIHAVFALMTFTAGGVAALVSYRILTPPMKYVSAVLGLISLATLTVYFATGDTGPLESLGPGGIERWIAYPIVFWALGFGAYLLGSGRLKASGTLLVNG